MRRRSDLWPYQTALADLVTQNPALLLSVPMSFGKTAVVLTAVRKMLDLFDARKVLVVAPMRVAINTWPDEIGAWEHTAVLDYTVIRAEDDDPEIATVKSKFRAEAKREKRERLAREDTPIHIINREAIAWLVQFWGDDWPYDTLIYDESSRLKAAKKKTGKGVLSEFGSLCKVRPRLKRVIELSGTPAPNSIEEIWGQVFLLDGGQRLGRSKTAFRSRWFDGDWRGWEYTPKPGAFEEITGAIKDVMFSVPKELAPRTPVVPLIRRVKLSPEELKEYRRFERTLVSEAHDVVAVNRGVLTNKLLQFANGGLYKQEEGGPRQTLDLHDHKLDELESLLAEFPGQNVIVTYSFQFDLEKLRKRFKHAKVFDETPDAVRLWNDKKIRLLLCHPANMAHGLNMQHGGHIIVWYGMTNSFELYDQLNARLPRPGQQAENVFIYHLIAENTADELAYSTLQRKDGTNRSVNAAVRLRLLNLEN